MKALFAALVCFLSVLTSLKASDYAYAPYNEGKMDPQTRGWPLSAEERAFVLKPEYERRPGSEARKHLPHFWPVVPQAGYWSGTAWLDTHLKLVEYVRKNQGPVDVLLVGDSITQQWGSPLDGKILNEGWKKHLERYSAVNIGIGGDKTQNVLWRLDHGGVDGLEPKSVVLMIGNNNMFFTPETGVESAARGIQACVENLRRKFPKAPIVVVKILPAHQPGNRFYEDIRKTNAAFDQLRPGSQPAVTVMDLTSDFTDADGSLHKEFFTPDNVHLSSAGYDHYAQRLKPVLNALISGQPVPLEALAPKPAPTPKTGSSAKKSEVRATSRLMVESKSVLAYPYGPYNEGKLDPQQTGWPLNEAELAWVSNVEYSRKPGHEAQKHLPEFWPVTPTAAHWAKPNESEANAWIDHHARILEQVRSIKGGVDVALIGDSITQHLGGGFDGSAFHPSWTKHFGDLKTANLGIGGDRVENILWRLDHGALDGVKVKVVVLLIGTNNAPLVEANGVPADQVAHGIALCVRNLRARLPQTEFIVVDILPAGKPGDGVHRSVKKINASLKTLKIDADNKVHTIDLWNEFTHADGSLKLSAYSGDRLHLSPEGYEIFASRLKPLIYKLVQTAN